MIAVIKAGGIKYVISEGEKVRLEKIYKDDTKNEAYDTGDVIKDIPVLMIHDEKTFNVGTPVLDGVTVAFRGNKPDTVIFDPLCLIGPNGTGKSQLLQVIAEIFQAYPYIVLILDHVRSPVVEYLEAA